ncbi:hypothetical protein [Stenotrophomonas sp. 57]|uniref:hypothetical protein n=1 Tax=Stenotrophomonas sp. 57 TaxID=3051119 RepID=UPI00256F5A3B|nr:hypothetical protein [Stenotrophomonas sp. 57]
MDPILNAEIPASDLARAIAFYQQWLRVNQGVRIYLGVDNLETRLARALEADAELRFGAEIRDSEGNRIALQARAVL